MHPPAFHYTKKNIINKYELAQKRPKSNFCQKQYGFFGFKYQSYIDFACLIFHSTTVFLITTISKIPEMVVSLVIYLYST